MSAAAPRSRPVVVVSEPIDPQCLAFLVERCEVFEAPVDAPDALHQRLLTADALVVRTRTIVDEALLTAAPRLRVVGRAGVGVDNIDLRACAARRVAVVHTPGANTHAVVEFVLALLLDALRPRLFLDRALTARQWEEVRDDLTAERQIRGMRIGLLGLGRIGSATARVLTALGAQVLYHDLAEIPADKRHGARPVSFDELLRSAEALSIHVDGRSSNRGLMGAGALALLRPDVVLLNTSRGFVLDEPALAAFLQAHPAARAVLDVHAAEPFPSGSPLLGLPNCFLTPHIAAATREAKRNMSWVVRDVWRVLSGERPEHEAPAP